MKMMTILYSNCDLCHPTSLLLPLSPPHPHSDIRDVIVAVTFVDVGEDQRAESQGTWAQSQEVLCTLGQCWED